MRTTMPKKDLLKTYRTKRNFKKTTEPAGESNQKQRKAPLFVIQKHDARRLHYDFRLEANNVLKSWAVPKGPSLDPADKRLAVQTEDHPMDYATFEGLIPEGEYGGGPVLVWDLGTYRNTSQKDGKDISIEKAIEKGHLTFWLEGKKLRGGFSLIRTSGRENRNWILVKLKDELANPHRFPVMTQPESVLSGRSIGEIAEMEQGELHYGT
jgi:DNA ligase D-like protein (predicted 3'-phosphoesterase)